jgi:hypothetical protein
MLAESRLAEIDEIVRQFNHGRQSMEAGMGAIRFSLGRTTTQGHQPSEIDGVPLLTR